MKYLLLITCCGALLLISPSTARDSLAPDAHQSVLASANGRYVFGQISEMRRDQFMLDTQTGRLWQLMLVSTNEEGGNELMPVPYVFPATNGERKMSLSPPP
jgi:hypothetical protein